MEQAHPIWLVTNAASGSNDEEANERLMRICEDSGFAIAVHTVVPEHTLPDPKALSAKGIRTVVIFTGDGTINSVIANLAGWDGAVLVLPGGTQNLLYHRLHGDHALEQVIAMAAQGGLRRVRPPVIACAQGQALAGLLAGPGTAWNRVREGMRHLQVGEVAAGTVAAISESIAGDMVHCIEPPAGDAEGYPLIMLTPFDDRMSITGFRAESAWEYLAAASALLQRDFRQGPHHDLGAAKTVKIATTGMAPFDMLIDGEPAHAEGVVEFRLASCNVDLLATIA